MPAGYAVAAVGRLHLALRGRANRCMSTIIEPLLCRLVKPVRLHARSESVVPKNTRRQFRGLSMHGAIAAHTPVRWKGVNGNRQRPTAQSTGLQQLARDKTLGGITVLLRPIPNAGPHVCRTA